MSALLFTGHSMLAGITKTPELALEESESGELARALNTVNSFYRVEVAEKTLAWLNLAMVGGMIYGTRLVAIRERRSTARAARRGNATTRETFSAAQPMPSPVGVVPDVDRGDNDAPIPSITPEEIGEVPEEYFPGFAEVRTVQ